MHVTAKQLSEHLTPEGVAHVLADSKFDWMILSAWTRMALTKKAVRIERVPGGYRVDHGTLRELRWLSEQVPMPPP